MNCNLCPKNCNIDRSVKRGACLCPTNALLSRIAPHMWEEPCISGSCGSGTVFFAGCNLKCRFCQNYDISVEPKGVEVSIERLCDVFRYVGESGVANINIVSPSQYSDVIATVLEKVKHKIAVPVVYNTNSYEKLDALKRLDGLVDVYLPDLKFFDSTLSQNMCGASNYFDVASSAVVEMLSQQPVNVFDGDGYLQKGVIVRHLVLPSHTEDSKKIIDFLASVDKGIAVSLMAQYFPTHVDEKFPELNRKLYKHEYENVKEYFFNVGMSSGYMQDPSSATEDFVPDFDVEAVKKLLKEIPNY